MPEPVPDPRAAIGRTRTAKDRLDPARARALHATLGLAGAPPGAGDPLPLFWHWIQFWDAQPPAALGPDGHPRTGGFIPDAGLPRRMWAGGRLAWHAPLRLGEMATRRTTIAAVEPKTGRSGALLFVTLRHEIAGPSGLALVEEQDLVYREAARPGVQAATLRPAPRDETAAERFAPDATELFRYSALTFNGHRIHYDLPWAQGVEGYPGLVVHGPLLAQRLVLLAERTLGRLARFRFQAVAPICLPESFAACAKPAAPGLSLWVRGEDGRLAMTAEAEGG